MQHRDPRESRQWGSTPAELDAPQAPKDCRRDRVQARHAVQGGEEGTATRQTRMPVVMLSPHPTRPTGVQSPLSPGTERKKPLMILPQVHLRKPCYDFYFL